MTCRLAVNPARAGLLLAWALWLSLSPLGFSQSTRPGMGAIPYADANGTGVTFRVWAPTATNVTVPGSFNGWNTTTLPLTKEPGTSYWSRDVSTARNGDQYKFYLNKFLWKRDPRGRKVGSSAGNSIVYDPNAFAWSGDTRLPVTASNTVIYELHIGAFYDSTPSSGGPGKFADAITKLDYLTNLGINAIEVMPISEFPGDNSWGYNPADIFAVENTGYGGPDGFKSFVKAAHQRGLRVLVDVVHNHYGPSDLDLYSFDVGTGPGAYFYTAANICCNQWGSRPNYASDGVRSFITDSFKMWLDECHVDGFRWDAVGAMRHYDPNYTSIPEADTLIQSINNTTIHGDHPGAFSIAEDDSGGMNFDSTWATGYGDTIISEMVKSTDSTRDMNALQNAINGSGFGRVVYSESHDLVGSLNGSGAQRLPYRIASTSPTNYFARKRSMLGAALVMTTPAIPMVFMGQEMLAVAQFSDSTPLDWSRTNTYSPVLNFYRDLIRLRRNLDGVSLGLLGPNISWHTVDNTAKLLSYHRWGAGPNDQVMCIANISNKTLTNYFVTGFPANGNWFVNLNSDWPRYSSDFANTGPGYVSVSGGTATMTIGPYSVLLLSRSALPSLDSDSDGLSNAWEQAHFGDPISAAADGDDDGDGMTNLQEQSADTDPVSAASALRITGIQTTATNVTVSWQGGHAARQILSQSTNVAGPWTPVFTNQPPTPITNSITKAQTGSAPLFFRVQASLP